MSHSLFNVASKIYPYDKTDLQAVDWFKIYESKDMGLWSHKGKVIV